MVMEIVKINNWSVVDTFDFVPRLHGDVENHPKLGNQKDMISSCITGRKLVNGNMVIVTKSGTYYKLGIPDTRYTDIYPNPEDMLMNSLPILLDV